MKLIKEELTINSQSFEDISSIAKRLSEILEIGDILFLKGSIGAGKSFFARCIIREYLNISKVYEDIPSPSFSLVQTYDNIKPKVCHVDLYRISFSSELEEIGLDNIYEKRIQVNIQNNDQSGKSHQCSLYFQRSRVGLRRSIFAIWFVCWYGEARRFVVSALFGVWVECNI